MLYVAIGVAFLFCASFGFHIHAYPCISMHIHECPCIQISMHTHAYRYISMLAYWAHVGFHVVPHRKCCICNKIAFGRCAHFDFDVKSTIASHSLCGPHKKYYTHVGFHMVPHRKCYMLQLRQHFCFVWTLGLVQKLQSCCIFMWSPIENKQKQKTAVYFFNIIINQNSQNY